MKTHKDLHSSTARLEKRGKKTFVVKTLTPTELHNELFFYFELKRAKLSKLETFAENGELFVEYKDKAKTLSEKASPKAYEAFGAFMRQVHSINFLTPLIIDQRGKEKATTWSKVIDRCLEEGEKGKGFSASTIKKAKDVILKSGVKIYNHPAALLHCDIHQNNVLLDKGLTLIDAGSAVAAGDPLYDLALLTIVLPGSVYLKKKKDQQYLAAFIKGYGMDFTKDRQRFDAYVLLRCLERWPNAFEKEIPKIVEVILSGATTGN